MEDAPTLSFINKLKARLRRRITQLEKIKAHIAAEVASLNQNPALITDYIQGLVVMASRLGATNAAVIEIDLVIQRLEVNITDAWRQALLARAAKATAAAAAIASIQAPDNTPLSSSGPRSPAL